MMRPSNIFALSSVAQRRGREVLTPDQGQRGIAVVRGRADVDRDSCEIMMHGIGRHYETIQDHSQRPEATGGCPTPPLQSCIDRKGDERANAEKAGEAGASELPGERPCESYNIDVCIADVACTVKVAI